jgi:hypothetical protein
MLSEYTKSFLAAGWEYTACGNCETATDAPKALSIFLRFVCKGAIVERKNTRLCGVNEPAKNTSYRIAYLNPNFSKNKKVFNNSQCTGCR